MLHLENKIKSKRIFPRIYLRYVDDIFAVVKKEEVENVRSLLSSQFDSINFTFETETEGKLPFLDRMTEKLNLESTTNQHQLNSLLEKIHTIQNHTNLLHFKFTTDYLTFSWIRLNLKKKKITSSNVEKSMEFQKKR